MTARASAEARLRRREAELAEAQAIAHIGSFVYELASGTVTWSDEMFRIYGHAPGAFVPTARTCLDATHPDDRDGFAAFAAAGAPAHAGPFEHERRIVRPDGVIRHVLTRGRVALGDLEGPDRVIGTAADITERKRTEQAIAEAAVRFQAIVRTTHEAIVLSDAQGRITLWNPAAEQLFGYAADAALGMPFRHLLAEGVPAALASLVTTCGQASEPMPALAITGRRRDGGTFPMELSCARWSTADGDQISHIIRDLGKREQFARVKDEFLAKVSHELRTPLNTVQCALDVLLGDGAGELPRNAQRMAEIAHRGVRRLHVLVSDILDLQSLGLDRVRLARRPSDLQALVDAAIELVQPSARSRDIVFELEVRPFVLDADPDRAVQVLVNLLANAIKFSPRGGVVGVSADACPDGAVVEVRDHGPGMPADQLEQVFGAFHQIAQEDPRLPAGVGLGLTICRHIVELHGGRIWVESAPGQGTRLRFTLPVADPTAHAMGPSER